MAPPGIDWQQRAMRIDHTFGRHVAQNFLIHLLCADFDEFALQKIHQMIQANIAATDSRIKTTKAFQVVTGQHVRLLLFNVRVEAGKLILQQFFSGRDIFIAILFF